MSAARRDSHTYYPGAMLCILAMSIINNATPMGLLIEEVEVYLKGRK